jgi:hypothetical protein
MAKNGERKKRMGTVELSRNRHTRLLLLMPTSAVGAKG